MSETTKNAHVTKQNKQGKTVLRYYPIPEDAMSAKAKALYDQANAAYAENRRLLALFEEEMTPLVTQWTVSVKGIGDDLPAIPEGYAPLFSYNYGPAVGAIPAKDKQVTTGKAKAVTINYGKAKDATPAKETKGKKSA